jgi:hypothetical protein
MAIDPHNHDHGYAHHADVAYEKTDLGHRNIWVFFTFLAISIIVIFLAVAALYKGFGYAEAKLQPEVSPMAEQAQAPVPAMLQNTAAVDMQKFSGNGTQPLLQSNEVADMDTFLKEEETLLKASPWKEANGNIHIPIEHAMQMVVQKNQPARANGQNPAASDPMMVPNDGGFQGFAAVQAPADATMAPGAAGENTSTETSLNPTPKEANTEPAVEKKGATHTAEPPTQKMPTPMKKVPAPKK